MSLCFKAIQQALQQQQQNIQQHLQNLLLLQQSANQLANPPPFLPGHVSHKNHPIIKHIFKMTIILGLVWTPRCTWLASIANAKFLKFAASKIFCWRPKTPESPTFATTFLITTIADTNLSKSI